MAQTYAHRKEYEIEFSESDWEEIISLTFEPFEFEQGESLTRGQWFAIAEMAIGKSVLILEGRYDGDGNESDNASWATQLREIADVILSTFTPGDGKL